jgi:hypothetical protein
MPRASGGSSRPGIVTPPLIIIVVIGVVPVAAAAAVTPGWPLKRSTSVCSAATPRCDASGP